jgi:hypothetical protein
MGRTGTRELRLVASPLITTEQEDARLNAFFLHIGGMKGALPYVLGTKLMIERGGTAREGWSLDNRAEGGSAAFLRATWLDASRAIISFGYYDGPGRTDIWKARFSDVDGLVDAEFLSWQPGATPVERKDALLWWYFGAGVQA